MLLAVVMVEAVVVGGGGHHLPRRGGRDMPRRGGRGERVGRRLPSRGGGVVSTCMTGAAAQVRAGLRMREGVYLEADGSPEWSV